MEFQGIVLVTEICLDNKKEQIEFERWGFFSLPDGEKGTEIK